MIRPPKIVSPILFVCALGLLTPDGFSATSRIKDISTIDGAQSNTLTGYGLVTGLSGTGDSGGGFTSSSLANMLTVLGVPTTAANVDPKNVAAVIVTAKLPPFKRQGTEIDIVVSSIGGAKNLQGGQLQQTPLMGADGKVHAVAQGPVSIGGFLAEGGGGGGGGASVQQNHTTVGTIPNGGTVEGEEIMHDILKGGFLRLNLFDPDFKTAHNLQESINEALGIPVARAATMGMVEIDVMQLQGTPYKNVVSLMAAIEELPVVTDMPAIVVLNENTGTVVAGEHIRIHPVAIAHGNLNITITTTQEKDPVAAMGDNAGTTDAETMNTDIQAEVEPGGLFLVEGATVKELVESLNQLGVNPRDLIAIFDALKKAGALKCRVVTVP